MVFMPFDLKVMTLFSPCISLSLVHLTCIRNLISYTEYMSAKLDRIVEIVKLLYI